MFFTLATVVAAHHAPGMDMGMGHMSEAAVVCLAIVPLLVLGSMARRGGSWPLAGPLSLGVLPLPAWRAPAVAVLAQARAGPPDRFLPLRL